MNLKVFATTIALSTAAALAVYAFSPLLIPAVGIGDILSSFWKLEALAIAFSILSAFAWPHVRGLKNGDRAVALVAFTHRTPGGDFIDYQMQQVVVLEDGRKGGRVKVALPDGSRGEAIVSEYAGAFSAATVQIIERELGR